MGYRAEWLTHAGSMATHSEVVLHLFDREVNPSQPIRMLVAGVGNGGAVEIWQRVLPAGSVVRALDVNPACAVLPIAVEVCDVTDSRAVSATLRGDWFDVVYDSTGAMSGLLWPFLKAGGVMIFEGIDDGRVVQLTRDLLADEDSWLPVEEVMRLGVYPGALVVEKRNPRVVPYLQVMAGNFADVTGEGVLRDRGVRLAVTGG